MLPAGRTEGAGFTIPTFDVVSNDVEGSWTNSQSFSRPSTIVACAGVRTHCFDPDIPHRGSDFGAFLAIKPCIPLSQELEEVLMLVSQIQNHESLSRDEEHMNPNGSSGTPSVPSGAGYACLLVREGGCMLLQDRADEVFEGRIDK